MDSVKSADDELVIGGLTANAEAELAEAHDPGTGPSLRSVEIAVALVLIALSAGAIWDNLRIGAGWADSGPQAGYFPLRVGVAIGLCGLAVAWQAWQQKSDAVFVTWLQLRRVAQVLLPLTVYIAGIGWLGIYVASALFIAAFMAFAGRYPWWKGLALGAFTNALMFFIFEIQFKVPLPKGPLEAWLGY